MTTVEHLFTSLDEMAQSDAIDAVYIASPNSLHFRKRSCSSATKTRDLREAAGLEY